MKDRRKQVGRKNDAGEVVAAFVPDDRNEQTHKPPPPKQHRYEVWRRGQEGQR